MYKNKGKQPVNKQGSRVESLAEDILRGDFHRIGPLVSDARQILTRFCVQGHLATREEYDENERKRRCDWTVEWAAEAIFVHILPEVFTAAIYGQGDEWIPNQDAEEASIPGLPYDILMFYFEDKPLAVLVYASEEYQEDTEDSIEYLESIQAIYVDEDVVSELELTDDDVKGYLDVLITVALGKRFAEDSDAAVMRRPTITVARNQEGYFEQMCEENLWGRTEQEAGYVVYN